jgi:hypothetical protein
VWQQLPQHRNRAPEISMSDSRGSNAVAAPKAAHGKLLKEPLRMQEVEKFLTWTEEADEAKEQLERVRF